MSELAFKGSSYVCGIEYVIIQRDSIGWKLDVYGPKSHLVSDGDTYQDSLDQLLPFLKLFTDDQSIWHNFDTDEMVSFWTVVSSFFDKLN